MLRRTLQALKKIVNFLMDFQIHNYCLFKASMAEHTVNYAKN